MKNLRFVLRYILEFCRVSVCETHNGEYTTAWNCRSMEKKAQGVTMSQHRSHGSGPPGTSTVRSLFEFWVLPNLFLDTGIHFRKSWLETMARV